MADRPSQRDEVEKENGYIAEIGTPELGTRARTRGARGDSVVANASWWTDRGRVPSLARETRLPLRCSEGFRVRVRVAASDCAALDP